MATSSITREIVLSEEGKRLVRLALASPFKTALPEPRFKIKRASPEQIARNLEELKQKRKEMGLD
jgi:hypothetical protein